MNRIEGTIRTVHEKAGCVAAALAPDNLKNMETRADSDQVVTTITGTQLRSVIASVDDYLMNLAVADDACSVRGKQKKHKKR